MPIYTTRNYIVKSPVVNVETGKWMSNFSIYLALFKIDWSLAVLIVKFVWDFIDIHILLNFQIIKKKSKTQMGMELNVMTWWNLKEINAQIPFCLVLSKDLQMGKIKRTLEWR